VSCDYFIRSMPWHHLVVCVWSTPYVRSNIQLIRSCWTRAKLNSQLFSSSNPHRKLWSHCSVLLTAVWYANCPMPDQFSFCSFCLTTLTTSLRSHTGSAASQYPAVFLQLKVLSVVRLTLAYSSPHRGCELLDSFDSNDMLASSTDCP
jgi:uncharacterized membrane protein